MDVIVVLGIFFIVITAIFIAVAVFLPEWLGITGQKAKEVIKSHTVENGSDAESTNAKPLPPTDS